MIHASGIKIITLTPTWTLTPTLNFSKDPIKINLTNPLTIIKISTFPQEQWAGEIKTRVSITTSYFWTKEIHRNLPINKNIKI
jgi:hypothetical protein